MKRNITLSLDMEVIQKVRILAARRQISVSRMLGQELERLVREADEYERAKRRGLTNLRKGWHWGGKGGVAREELHAR